MLLNEGPLGPSQIKEEKKKEIGKGFIIFLSRFFYRKTLIHGDPTVQTQIRLWKHYPYTWIYVFTDCFEVKH
jgi:hypothetical protein